MPKAYYNFALWFLNFDFILSYSLQLSNHCYNQREIKQKQMPIALASKLLLSLILGALIGLERESSSRDYNTNGEDYRGSIGGIRTFALISLLGGIAGLFYNEGIFSLFLIITIAIFVFIFGYYILGTSLTKLTGMTTELSALFTFIIGFLITTEIIPIPLSVAILIILILVLSMKAKTKKFVLGLGRKEVESFITYAIIALVILPFLPNKDYYIYDIPGAKMILTSLHLDLGKFTYLEIINPYRLWFIVALITGIDILGHFLGKFFGNKGGTVLASTVGGFISSTATTQSLAQRSRKQKLMNQLVGAAILANLASFIQVTMLITPLNAQWAAFIIPTIVTMILVAGIFASFFLMKKRRGKEREEKIQGKEKSIFSLGPALKFALLLTGIKIITKGCLIIFGQGGFLVSSMIASFAGIDAIMVNLAEMAGKTITFQTALLAFVLVNATNLLSKTGYSYLQGKKEFANKLLVAMVGIIIAGFVGYLLF